MTSYYDIEKLLGDKETPYLTQTDGGEPACIMRKFIPESGEDYFEISINLKNGMERIQKFYADGTYTTEMR